MYKNFGGASFRTLGHSCNFFKNLEISNFTWVHWVISWFLTVNVSDYFQIWYVHSTSYSKTNYICFTKIDQVVLEMINFKDNHVFT